MAKATHTYTMFRCDRCGSQVRLDEGGPLMGWGEIAAKSAGHDAASAPTYLTGPPTAGKASIWADICPGCRDSFVAWWKAKGG